MITFSHIQVYFHDFWLGYKLWQSSVTTENQLMNFPVFFNFFRCLSGWEKRGRIRLGEPIEISFKKILNTGKG